MMKPRIRISYAGPYADNGWPPHVYYVRVQVGDAVATGVATYADRLGVCESNAWVVARRLVERLQRDCEYYVDCCNGECGWTGIVRQCVMLGEIGPLCPECNEVVEPAQVEPS